MQRKALRELNRYRAMGQDKALVVAATGSGKTYLVPFSVGCLEERITIETIFLVKPFCAKADVVF